MNTEDGTHGIDGSEPHHVDLGLDEPDDHPIGSVAGTGAGAVVGSIAGTVIGGPIGTIVGGVVGGIVGAAAGHGTASIVNPGADHVDHVDHVPAAETDPDPVP